MPSGQSQTTGGNYCVKTFCFMNPAKDFALDSVWPITFSQAVNSTENYCIHFLFHKEAASHNVWSITSSAGCWVPYSKTENSNGEITL